MAKPSKGPKLHLLAEPWESASPDRPGCQECGAYQHCHRPFMPPWLPEGWTGKLLIIGERPGGHEDERSGRPFTGRAGELLHRMIAEYGFTEKDVAFHNVARCRHPENKAPTMREIRLCRPFLLDVIRRLRPEFVLGVGDTAAKALTDMGEARVTRLRGRPVEVPGLAHNPPLEPQDCLRIEDESQTRG